jgi:spore coat polysaccharide biosynthesis protein SpsF
MTFSALESDWREAREPYQREHVTPFLYQHPERFKLLSVKGQSDYSQHRWTLDTPEDLQLLRAIYARTTDGSAIGWQDVLKIVENEPELAEMNKHIAQKAMQ